MAVTSSDYKAYGRLARYLTIEDLFNLGMSYTDTPLASGYSKLLVNYDLKNQGTSLAPRGGLKLVTPTLANTLLDYDTHPEYAIHHTGMTLVKSVDGLDATMHKYILVAPIITHPLGMPCFLFDDIHCFLETPSGFLHASAHIDYYSKAKPKLTNIHETTITPEMSCNTGIYVSIEANTYIPVIDAYGVDYKFTQLVLQFTSANTFTIALPALTPKEVTAAQVINTGYNLMQTDPYAFANTQNATGSLVLNGVIPKDGDGKIKLTADVGEVLLYHLHYTYPAGDASKQYMVQWEVKDTTTSTDSAILMRVRQSPAYNPGADILYPYIVAYKQFTLIVKVYYKTDVDAHTYISDDDDYKNLTPLKVITVSSYYTTAGVSGNTANLTTKSYTMATCKNVCAWQQRVVLWGVDNAATTLFVSQPNLPEYVPYPNNVEVFPEDIVHCVPYLNYLLVFTTSKLYRVSLATNGILTYYTTKCIQERLTMTPEDASTITVVKNMVYFKSENYFYMIVPNTSAGVDELQLAPVSRPIEALLDNFTTSVPKIIDSVYNLAYVFGTHTGAEDYYTTTLVDYTNYLDGSTMRNVYKYKLKVYKANVLSDTRYINFILNYDTVLRAWTTYTYEASQHRAGVYESTITSGIILCVLCPANANSQSAYVQLIKLDTTSPKDEAPIAIANKERVLLNYQLLDTGYRAHYPVHKKRFREIQFSVNNTNQDQLQFYTSFTVDDDARRELFKYEVQQITDPNSTDFGLIYVERVLDNGIPIAGAIKLESGWVLDFSKFPTITVSKVRYRVSGKGYLGKISILNRDQTLYELLGTNWVYRKMNAR